MCFLSYLEDTTAHEGLDYVRFDQPSVASFRRRVLPLLSQTLTEMVIIVILSMNDIFIDVADLLHVVIVIWFVQYGCARSQLSKSNIVKETKFCYGSF